MKKHRGKAIAWSAAAFALAILGVAAWAFKDAAIERWHLHRLENGSGAEKRRALEKLAEAGSKRAIPHLLNLIRGEDALGVEAAVALLGIDPDSGPRLLEAMQPAAKNSARRSSKPFLEEAWIPSPGSSS